MTICQIWRLAAMMLALLLMTQNALAQGDAPSQTKLRQSLDAAKLSVTAEATRLALTSQSRDSLWNGALIGAGVGFGFALYDYLIDPSEPDNGIIFATAIGLGAAIGTGIDALISQNPQPTKRLRVAPLLRQDRRGIVVSARF